MLVEVGGDLAVSGRSPDGLGWNIAVAESPEEQSPPTMICLSAGGVATSTTRRRRWTTDDAERHHLIDPATVHCSTRAVHTSTVVAGSAAVAEAFAKVAFGQSLASTLATLDGHRLAGRLRLDDRSVRTSAAWSQFDLALPDASTGARSGARR